MILCFSGNGNSLKVARGLARRLDDSVWNLSLRIPDDSDEGRRDIVVWTFPIHAWGVPSYLRKMIRNAPFPEWFGAARHIMVATCGDDCGYAARMWRSEMNRRGWNSNAAFSVTMPNTYVNLPGFDVDAPDVEAIKLREASLRLDDIASMIESEHCCNDVVEGAVPWLKTVILYPLFVRFLMSTKPFKVDDSCNGCGRCVAICPRGNIRVDEKTRKAVHSSQCSVCMGCYHVCPRHAVNYGRATIGKGHYSAPDIDI